MVKIVTDSVTGSGVIYDVDSATGVALILTNRHVIEGASRISAVVTDTVRYDATLRGFDGDVDLAVLRICCNTGLSSAQLVKSGSVAIGDRVYALGYPLGANSIRVTEGIVSASEYSAVYGAYIIQTDAALNPGNSGGPLIRSDGLAAGINTARKEQSDSGRPVEGTGYAIAARTVLTRLPDIERGAVTVIPSPTVIPTPRATPRPNGQFRQLQLDDGAMPHEDDGFIKTRRVASGIRNFAIFTDFEVPYSVDVGDWDFGFTFRDSGDGNLSYVALTQDGRYAHHLRIDGDDRNVKNGPAENLRLSAGTVNTVTLIVVEDRGWLFVNSEYISDFDVSGSSPRGELTIATGIYKDSEVPGYSTKFSNVIGEEVDLLAGPDTGHLTKGDDFIAVHSAGVDITTSYVRVDLETPINTTDWSSGVFFRAEGEKDYLIFMVTSERLWSIQHATYSGDDWQQLEGGHSSAIIFNDPILNTLELFFVGSLAVMYVNEEFLGTADISSVNTSGDVAVAYGIYANDLPSTGSFENFEVWGSPYD